MSGTPGRGQPQQRRAERRVLAAPRDARDERLEVVEERLVLVERAHELLDAPLVLARRLDPVRVALRLAQRLLEVRSSRVRSIGHAPTSVCQTRYSSFGSSMPPVSVAPAPHALRPLLGHAGERADARAHVAGALRVVRLRARAGAAGSAPPLERWRGGTRPAAARSGPGRRRPRSAQSGGSSGRTPCPRRPSPSPGRSSAASASTNSSGRASSRSSTRAARPAAARRSPRGPPRRRCRPRLDVGAVDMQRRRRPPRAALVGRARAGGRTPCANVVRACSSFASCAISAKVRASRRSARRRARVSGSSPRGSTKSAVDVVRELVAGRPLDRPVAQRLAGLEDLLDPDVRDAGVAQPLRYRAGSASPSGWSMRSPSTSAVARRARGSCGASPRRPPGSSTRTPASSPTSKKRRYQPVSGSKSKKCARSSGRARSGSPPPRSPCGSGRCRARCRGRRVRGAQSARNSSSPPSSSEIRVGSTTS